MPPTVVHVVVAMRRSFPSSAAVMALICEGPVPPCHSSQCTGSTASATQLAPVPETLVEPVSTQRPPPALWHALTFNLLRRLTLGVAGA